MSDKARICLWYTDAAEEAARFYAQTFPDSAIGAIVRAPTEYPGGAAGSVVVVEFTVLGLPCMGLNGGPMVAQTEAFSFQIATDDQQETDHYWNAIIGNGGKPSACGWCKDKWGVSWQVTPRILTRSLSDPDEGVRRRVFQAMMGMIKIDVAGIEAARRGV